MRIDRWWVAWLFVLACGPAPGQDVVPAPPEPAGTEIEPSLETLAAPPDAVRFCGGHVTAAPTPSGLPGSHIVWDAYYSLLDLDELARAYPTRYPAPERTHEGACIEWRLTEVQPRRVLEICPPDAEGPWTECEPPPPEAKSIVLVSTLTEAS